MFRLGASESFYSQKSYSSKTNSQADRRLLTSSSKTGNTASLKGCFAQLWAYRRKASSEESLHSAQTVVLEAVVEFKLKSRNRILIFPVSLSGNLHQAFLGSVSLWDGYRSTPKAFEIVR